MAFPPIPERYWVRGVPTTLETVDVGGTEQQPQEKITIEEKENRHRDHKDPDDWHTGSVDWHPTDKNVISADTYDMRVPYVAPAPQKEKQKGEDKDSTWNDGANDEIYETTEMATRPCTSNEEQ